MASDVGKTARSAPAEFVLAVQTSEAIATTATHDLLKQNWRFRPRGDDSKHVWTDQENWISDARIGDEIWDALLEPVR